MSYTMTQKIKVSETFFSLQGEGRFMGVPSVFLRTFGCNFTCGGFGMLRGELSVERDNIAVNAKSISDYRDLPLVSTGCDSYASWDTRFKHLSPLFTIDSIVDSIMGMLPFGEWREEHLVITGGEPLLGWQRSYPELLSHDKMKTLNSLTFETNGTQELSQEFADFLKEWTIERWHPENLTFSVSPKLPNSGEKWSDAIKPKIIQTYAKYGYVYLKFVVATEEDVTDAEKAVAEYRDAGFYGPVYLMPVGGVESVYTLNNKTVALMALKRGWRYSDRLQVPLFKNQWGT